MKQLFRITLLLFITALTIASCKKDDNGGTADTLPVITNVQPKNPAPGDVVTITGTNFGNVPADVKVTIGSQVLTIQSVTATEIKFVVPAGLTAGDIAVAIKNVIAANTDPQKAAITPQSLPVTVTALLPATGKAGDMINVTGTNFSTTIADDVFKFNGITATVKVATASLLTVEVPAGVTTGTVSLSVKGATAVTGPVFTVAAVAVGTAVDYIVTVSGTAKFGKIASATSEIGAMVVDKKNNVLYYSDYSPYVSNHPGTLYKLKLDGSAPVALSTDSRINTVVLIGVDVSGNVFAVAGLDQFGTKANVYKIDGATAAVTEIVKNAAFGGSGDAVTIDSQGGIWLGYGQKLNVATGAFDRNATFGYASYHNALYQGDDV